MLLNKGKNAPGIAATRLAALNNPTSAETVSEVLSKGNCTQNGNGKFSLSEQQYYGAQCVDCPLLEKGCIRGNTRTNENITRIFPTITNYIAVN